MNIKLFSVCLYNLIQIISAQVLRQDVASLDILNNLQYIPLADLIRSKRQFNNPPVNLNKNANLPNGLGNGMPFSNVLPNNINNNGIINGRTLPFNLPFSNINIGPQNRILPNINPINNNAFTINNLLASNNVIENLNNLPNPGSILPNNNPLPNILPNINQVPNVLPSLEKEPCNILPSLCNNGLPQSNLPFSNVLPSTNLPNSNILPSNNNLPNINLMPTNSLPNVLPQNNLPNGNVMPINNLPYNDVLPSNNLPINTLPPNLENFRITGFQFADGVTNFNGIPQNNLPIGNLNNNNVNQMQAFNIIPDTVQRIPEELSAINNCQNHNGNTGSNSLPINIPFNNGFSSCNLPIGNIPSPITSEPQYINYYAKGNGMPDARNVIGNPMPVTNHQLNGIPFNNGIPLANNPLIGTTVMPVNVLPPSNNIILIDPIEAYLQNVISSGILNNNHNQCATPQVPVNNFQYEYLNNNMPVIPNFPENDCQADFVFNNLNLAQEIVKSLKIEGLENLPFLNGLPVAGITETVTVLNSPCM